MQMSVVVPLPPQMQQRGGALLQTLFQVTELSPEVQRLRARHAEARRTRAPQDDPQLAAGVSAHHGTEAVQAQERRIAPNSHAARKQLQTDSQQQAAQQRQVFQNSLREAQHGRSAASGDAAAGRSAGGDAANAPAAAGSATKAASAQQASNRTAAHAEAAEQGGSRATTPASGAAAAMPAWLNPAGAAGAITAHNVGAAVPQSAAAGRGGAQIGAATVVSGSAAPAAARATGAAAPIAGSSNLVTKPQSSAAPAGTKPAAQPQSAKHEVNVERILRVLRSQLTRERAQATLRLDPPELGKIKMHMDLRQENLTLRIETQSVAAHRLLTERLDSLRQGLEAGGIHLERIEIRPPETPQPPQADAPQDGADQREPAGDQAGDASAERSGADGTDSSGAAADAAAADETIIELATESLVNILA